MKDLASMYSFGITAVSTPSESNPKIGTFAKESTPTTITAFENLEFHEQFFKERVKRLPHLKKDALEFYKNVEVTYSMIDHNKHMNNTHYFDFFLDAFAPEKPIQIAQIEYLNQAYLGNIIELFKYKDGEFDELYGFIGENPIFHLRVKYF